LYQCYGRVGLWRTGLGQTIAMRYLTDGTHLYEVLDRRTVRNYGLKRGSIRYVIIRDCVSEATATIDELQLLALSEVC
jgi:N-methylhydantoinase B/oxoprolinase/acetone carboxylase alpha subunit